eukprot:5773213-Pleurochrysis_carterae.AAC.1
MAHRHDPKQWRGTARYQMHLNLNRQMREAKNRPGREAAQRALQARLMLEQESIAQTRPTSVLRQAPQTLAAAPQPSMIRSTTALCFHKGSTSPITRELGAFSQESNGQSPNLAPSGHGRAGPASVAAEALNILTADSKSTQTKPVPMDALTGLSVTPTSPPR